jgi:pyruvate dehydrogenase E2 component (dihydrolipoamide acetyltransferase)
MPTEITMPSLAAGMQSAVLLKWLKGVGDPVSAGEVVAEVEADKAAMEVEAPVDGTIGALLVTEGADVPVSDRIALIIAPGEKFSPATKAPPPVKGHVVETEKVVEASVDHPTRNGLRASPLARRMAQEAGLSLASIDGSGPKGRIVRKDVEAAGRDQVARRALPPAAPMSARANDDDGERVPLSGMRRTIAQRLVLSKQTIPHFYLTIDCMIDRTIEVRRQMNERPGADYKLSLNDFVVKSVAAALSRVPDVNQQWGEDHLRRLRTVDISIAVATDGGLITPIVRDADHKGLAQISNEIKDLATRARAGQLKPSEYQGGGFSISNLGMYGVREFSAIINPPQSAILAVGAAGHRAVVVDGQIEIATMMTCTLSADHRVVDGATGAQFLAAFKRCIEEPLNLLV